MRPSDDILAELDAIDATLRGDAVDPEFADLAELALLLAADRPLLAPPAADRLDARAADRFARRAEPRAVRRGRTGRPGLRVPMFSGVAAALAAVVIVAVLATSGGGGGTSSSSSTGTSSVASSSGAGGAAHTSGTAQSAAGSAGRGLPGFAKSASPARENLSPSRSGTATSRSGSGSAAASSASGHFLAAPAPIPNGRRTEQTASLQLSAQAGRINAVSQELFDAVGALDGIVEHSQVTSGSGGFATFTLSIPSGNLQEAMTRLSELPGADVVSRTDQTIDVNSTYLASQHALSDANALHAALVRELAGASTQAQIDSLTSQIHSAEQQIAGDQQQLNSLNAKISYSALTVVLNPGAASPGPGAHSSGGGLSFGRAAHDAGRVLVTAAGVALIVLAVLVPLALLTAVIAWIALLWRRRLREHALDAT